jgi:hypothetical protein
MRPLIALVVGSLVLRVTGLVGVDALDAWQPALRGGLARMLVLTRAGALRRAPSRRAHRHGAARAAPPPSRRLELGGRPVTPLGVRTLPQVIFVTAAVAGA